MCEQGKVIKIEGSVAEIQSLVTGACINCKNSSCAKKGGTFKAVNSLGLPLTVGSLVRVSAPAGRQLVQAASAIVLPFAAAFAGYAAGMYAGGPGASEVPGVAGAFAGFTAAALCVFFYRSRKRSRVLPEITELAVPGTGKNVP